MESNNINNRTKGEWKLYSSNIFKNEWQILSEDDFQIALIENKYRPSYLLTY